MILACYKKKVSASKIEAISPPAIPRKRRKPNYSILYYVTENPEATAAAHYPESPYEHYKPIYYKAFNSIFNTIKDKFDQPIFKLFTQAEQLFLKAVGKQNVTDELKVLEKFSKVTMTPIHSLQSFNYIQRSSNVSPSIWKN